MKYGTKYNKDLDIKEIAKLVRQDLKKKYPQYKHSVRIERYSLGQSMYITTIVKADKYAKSAIRDNIYDIVHAYNFDDSDPMSDYHHVNFYAHISLKETA